jgi:L-rhamnose mutarotase
MAHQSYDQTAEHDPSLATGAALRPLGVRLLRAEHPIKARLETLLKCLAKGGTMRICFTSQVSPDLLDQYRAAHSAVWPEMLKALWDTGWRDYRLYLRSDGLLVGTADLPDSYGAAQARMAATEVNTRWQAAMAEFFVADGDPDQGMLILDQVFCLEDQLQEIGFVTEQ